MLARSQLRGSGVFDAVALMKAAYPTRIRYDDIHGRCAPLPAPKLHGAMHGTMHGATHKVLHGAMHGVMHGVMHGMMNGVMRGAMHDVMHGAMHDVMRGAMHGVLHLFHDLVSHSVTGPSRCIPVQHSAPQCIPVQRGGAMHYTVHYTVHYPVHHRAARR